ASRQGSVLNGLESLNADEPSTVLIHDAARPLVDPGVISRVLAALQTSPGAIPALAVADTLKRSDGQFVETTVDRQGLWRAQTPQGFRFEDILSAHRQVGGEELGGVHLGEGGRGDGRLIERVEDVLESTVQLGLASGAKLEEAGSLKLGKWHRRSNQIERFQARWKSELRVVGTAPEHSIPQSGAAPASGATGGRKWLANPTDSFRGTRPGSEIGHQHC
ncbi:MAG: bifunctional 2-C-methyl-D-erythritol 4-phosphate cytidylyltransferase/2-C-methyl-D-erythritol 2,4-cyclodiphosphate synthase, partial [Planctomycetota bacterium]